MKPKVSILIISWNSWPDLKRCLQALAAGDLPDVETVVIDNASRDGSVANLRRHFRRVKVHVNSRNIGHPRAVNQGFTLVRGTYVLVLDADTVLRPESLKMLVDFLDKRADVSVVAPRTFNTDGSVQESARDLPSAMSGLFGRQSLLTRWFPNNPFSRRYLMRDKLNETEPFEVRQVSSACMLLRRRLIDEDGGWDEGYGGYWVETDWCRRLQRNGRRIYCLPRASVIHHESNRAGRKRSVKRICDFHAGAFRYYYKHHTLGPCDPRAVFALVALAARAGVQIVRNWFLRERPNAAEKPDKSATEVEPENPSS